MTIILAASGCIHAAPPDANRMSGDVERLEQAFPVFEELHVRGFRDQDWCKFRRPKAFDDAASADFARVADALRNTDVKTHLVWWVEYDAAGRMRSAEFDLAARGSGRWSYIYDRGNKEPKEDIKGESVYTRINDDWWFWWEDWN